MKKIVLLLIFFAFCMANAVVNKGPSSFSIVSFAVQNFANNPSTGKPWADTLSSSIDESNTIVNTFVDQISSIYPNTYFPTPIKFHNAQVTKSVLTSNISDNYNFVYINTHGNVNFFIAQPFNEYIYNYNKKFGGNTYWAMIKACLVFKNGEANQDPWFNGVHSIIGYSSLSWGYQRYKHYYRCGFLNIGQCSYSRASYYVERDFVTNWIKEKQGIWESYKNAVYKWIYKERGLGVEPKIVYRYGYVDGKFFDPWEETFENSIQKPVFKNPGEYTGIGSRWSTMGTPCYSASCK